MEETLDDVVAISDTLYEGRMYESVEGRVVIRLPYPELHEEAELEDPSCRE